MRFVILLAESGREGNMLADILMLAGVLMLLMLLLINVRGRLRRRQSEPGLAPYEKVERIRQSHGMKNDLREMMVELEDLTRRFSAQLDAKALRLEKLIEEADERLARMEHADPAASARPSPPNGDGHGPQDGQDTRPSREGPPAAAPAAPAEPPEQLDPLTRNVYRLADAGHEPLAIARELDEQVGKVELILALRQ